MSLKELDKNQETYVYKGKVYPDYLKRGNAASHIIPVAQHFCKGDGLDIGGTPYWSLPGSTIINPEFGQYDAYTFPQDSYDYIFSSHCLEHLEDYVSALVYWRDNLRKKGQLFLYLPHPSMEYWLPQNCKKHLHKFDIPDIIKLLKDLGFTDIFNSERDLYWSFAVTGVKR